MSALNNIKIGTKLVGSFLLVALIIVAVSIISYFNLQTINGDLHGMYENNFVGSQPLNAIYTAFYKLRGDNYKYMLIEAERPNVRADILKDIENINNAINEYRDDTLTQSELSSINKLDQTWAAYQREVESDVAQADQGDIQGVIEDTATGATHLARNAMDTAIQELINGELEQAKEANDDGARTFTNALYLLLGASIFAVIMALVLGFVLSGSITGPLQKGVDTMREMSLGHLGNRLNMRRHDEIGILADSMDSFADDLQNIVSSMKKIAAGDLNVTVSVKDARDEINPALETMVKTLRLLVEEINRMSREQNAGDLDAKINAELFSGVYREVAQGIVAQVFEHLRIKRQVVDVVSHYAKGDFAPQVEKLPGKKAYINDAIDGVRNSLREMLTSISNAATNLSSAAAEILAATTQQASGASEQSAAISQTTTTVEEVKTSAEQAAMRAQDVATASQRTVEVARSGQSSVQATIESMSMIKERVEGISENLLALSDQTQQIGEIIATVNEIASQSNMLALNASVEAARAGEHGKGFAVVATEVRSLAEQSRQATDQIKAILSEIQKATNSTVMATEEGVKGVDRGVQLSMQSREAIEQLAAVINESAQVAAQVVASGQQQQTGIDQISLAMQNINQVTLQSLASTRQAEKSAQGLNDLARQLSEILAQYRF